jgi:hypothetical protein
MPPQYLPIASAVIYRDVMWRKVANGVYWIEDVDGLPVALATTLGDGTPLRVAEQWWDARRGMVESSLDWVRLHLPDLGWPEQDG